MNIKIVVKRLLFFVLVVWAASTIVFFIPRLSSRNAIRERFGELARTGGFSPGDIEKLIAEIAPLDSSDPKFIAGAAKALGIYWRDTIDVPVIQWLHRIPYNNHYWKNWPSSTNVGLGTNGAFWAHTGMLVIAGLQPSGAQ